MHLRQIATLDFNKSLTRASMQFPEVTLSGNEPDLPTVCIEEAGVLLELEFPDAESLLRFQQRVAALQWTHTIDAGTPTLRIPVSVWERVIKAIQTGARLPEIVEESFLGFDLDPFCIGCRMLLDELARPGAEVGTP